MINHSRYKDIQFYSNFPYTREVEKGVVTSTDNGFGAQELNTTRPIPAGVADPPYIRFFVEWPSNTFRPVQAGDGLLIGYTNTLITFEGFLSEAPFDQVFKVHYFIYDRLAV